MSIKIMTAVWDLESIKGTEKLVLLALADYANDDGIGWPSLATIAKKCGCSRRYTIRIVNHLESLGYLRITARKISRDMNQSNIYQVVVNPSSPGVVNYSSLGSEPGFTRVVNYSSPKPSFNHQLTNKNNPIHCAFIEKTGISPDGNEDRWEAGLAELEKVGVSPGEIPKLIDAMHSQNYNVAGPWSLLTWAKNSKAKTAKRNGNQSPEGRQIYSEWNTEKS